MCNDFEIQNELVFCLWHKFFEEKKKTQTFQIKLTFPDGKFNLTGMLNHLVSDLRSQTERRIPLCLRVAYLL